MDDAKLLQIEPSQLTFHFEVKEQISCSLHLANKTTNYVAFKVKTTNPKKYCVRPNIGIITPQQTCDLTVTMQAQQTPPLNFDECKDKFLIQSMVVPLYTSLDDISPDQFVRGKNKSKHVEEKKLKVVLLPPNRDFKQNDPSNSTHVQNETEFQNLCQPLNVNCNLNDGSQLLSLAKDIEQLKKDVEELKSKMSDMVLKLIK